MYKIIGASPHSSHREHFFILIPNWSTLDPFVQQEIASLIRIGWWLGSPCRRSDSLIYDTMEV